MCDIVSKGGNLLLNVPPRADGTFHPGVVSMLEGMGDFLKANGQAIFNTTPWVTFGERSWAVAAGGNCTRDPRFTRGYFGICDGDWRFTRGLSTIFAIGFGWKPDRDTAATFTIRSLNTSVSLGPVGTSITNVSVVGDDSVEVGAVSVVGGHIYIYISVFFFRLKE